MYLQLSAVLRSRISSGEWQVGQRIPTVQDLSKAYGVAGMTSRQALGILEEEGLIERFRAKGTFVLRRPERNLWCAVKTDFSRLLNLRPGVEIEVLGDRRDVGLPYDLCGYNGDEAAYRHVQRLHRHGETPYLVTDVYLSSAIAGQIDVSELTTKTAVRMVYDMDGVELSDAKQVVFVDRADFAISQALGVHLDDPIMRVDRVVSTPDKKALMICVLHYRADGACVEMSVL